MTWLVILKVSLVSMLALMAAAVLKRRSAAVRHALLQTALFAALLIPVLSEVLPGWRALPQPAVSAAVHAPDSPVAERPERAESATVPAVTGAGEPMTPPVDWGSRLTALWLIGVAALLVLFVLRVTAMEMAVRRARSVTDRRWLTIADSAAGKLGIRVPVEVRRWRSARMPST